MKSFGKVDCTLTVPLGGGETQPVDRAVLAEWLRKIGRPSAGRPRTDSGATMAVIADAVESAAGNEVSVPVRMSAEDADSVRLSVVQMTDKAANPPRGADTAEVMSCRAAAYGLTLFYRGWVACTGWQGIRQVSDTMGAAALGSGYSR